MIHPHLIRLFGAVGLKKLFQLPVGVWHGPVRSGYGLHLFLISSKTDAALPKLAEVHEKVKNEWLAEQRKTMNEAFL